MKINVVHLVEDLKVGGLEMVVSTIACNFNSDIFDVRVWCLAREGKIFDELKKRGCNIENLGMKSHRNPFFYLKFYKKLKESKIDIIHMHGYSAATVGRIAAVMAKVKVKVTHVHTTWAHYAKKRIFIEKILSVFTDAIICCSNAVIKSLGDDVKISRKKLKLIYNGIDIERFESNESKNGNKDFFSIGCVASLSPHKGHKYLIEAAKDVIGKKTQVKFIIVGDGKLRKDLEDYTKELGIDNYFEFKGIIGDVAEVIKKLDLFILPSCKREGLGIALIEAMAAGVPVIGTNIGGIPEVIKDRENGFLVEPGSSKALADVINYALENQDKVRAVGKNGYQSVKGKFSQKTMIDNIENLYQELFK